MRPFIPCALGLAITATSLHAQAQEQKRSITDTTHQLQEVQIITGYNKFAKKESNNVARLPLRNIENPQVYNVVPHEILTDQAIVTYNDVLKNVSGVSQGLVNGSNTFFLRGFLTSSLLRNDMQQQIGNSIEVQGIERIEVLKGPSATLFGSTLTSFGGLVNRITKKPYEDFGGEVSVTRGGFDLSRITADVNTPLNAKKGLYLRTNFAYHDEGSFQDAGFTRRFLFAPSFMYKVNDRLTILLDAEVYAQKANDFNRLFPEASLTLDNPRKLGIDYRRSYSSNDLYETQPSVTVYGQAKYKLSDKWTSTTAFSQSNASLEGYWSWNEIISDSVVSRNPGHEHTDQGSTEVQQNFNGDFLLGNMRNRVVLGLDYLTTTTHSTASSIYGYDNVFIHQKDPRYYELTRTALDAALAKVPVTGGWTGQDVYSAYISDVLNITRALSVMASIRVDHFVSKGTNTADTTYGRYHQTAPSPKLGLVYQVIQDKLSVFGNYMNGFQNNSPGRQPNGQFTDFKPSHANQWEAGIKADLLAGRLTGTASYYHIHVNDVIHTAFDGSGFSVQDGSQLSKGFEAEVIANPAAGLNIIAGYSHNDIYTQNQEASGEHDGLRQWNGPAETANLWISYHLHSTALKGLQLGIGGNYNGKAYIEQTHTQGSFYIPEYTVLNASLGYERKSWRVVCKLDNLTNEVYWGSYISQMMPRRFSTTVAVKF